MWHAGRQYTKEEVEVIRELEYDLFMFDPGFRSAWNNNFERYFEALFDEELWEKHQRERSIELDKGMGMKMMQDSEFAQFMKHEALIDSVLLGEIPLHNAPMDIREEVREIYRESEEAEKHLRLHEMLGVPLAFESNNDLWQKDPLFNQAFEWGDELGKAAVIIYEKDRNIEIFRILNNCSLVASKIIGAIDYEPFEGEDWQWRLDRNCYTLSLTSLQRCIESLEKLDNNFKPLMAGDFIGTAKKIRQALIDRLDKIEQSRFKSLKHS